MQRVRSSFYDTNSEGEMRVSYPKLHSIRWKGLDNVEFLDVTTTEDIDPVNVLMAAINVKLTSVVLFGYTQEGETYLATSQGDINEAYGMLAIAHKQALDALT